MLSEFSEGVGEAVPSAAKLFLVGGGEGISARTAASWGGVVRGPRVAVATVNPEVSSNEGGVKREGLPALWALWVSWDCARDRARGSSGGLGFVAPPPSGGGGDRQVPEREGGDPWSAVACDDQGRGEG